MSESWVLLCAVPEPAAWVEMPVSAVSTPTPVPDELLLTPVPDELLLMPVVALLVGSLTQRVLWLLSSMLVPKTPALEA